MKYYKPTLEYNRAFGEGRLDERRCCILTSSSTERFGPGADATST
jgi:hypothetical protein